MNKSDYRNQIIRIRNQIGKDQLHEFSKTVIEQYCSLDSYKNSKIIFAYSPMDFELDLRPFIMRALNEGKTVAVPKTYHDEAIGYYMQFAAIDENTVYEKDKFGIDVPINENIIVPESQKIEMIMPGLAFDLFGHRIGYGGGFYDRYLHWYNKASIHKVALCFDFQVFDELPAEYYDINYDVLITENRYYFRTN